MILPDYLGHGLDVVFCGTAAGNTSAARKHYFSDPGNPFWAVLHEAGFTTERLIPERDRQVLAYRLGLTDLVKFHSGIDADLHESMYDIPAFEKKILKFKPRYVAFTSKQAAADYYGHGKTKNRFVRLAGSNDRCDAPVRSSFDLRKRAPLLG